VVRRRKSATQRITEKVFIEFVRLVNDVPLAYHGIFERNEKPDRTLSVPGVSL